MLLDVRGLTPKLAFGAGSLGERPVTLDDVRYADDLLQGVDVLSVIPETESVNFIGLTSEKLRRLT